jgi:hypothetical protein
MDTHGAAACRRRTGGLSRGCSWDQSSYSQIRTAPQCSAGHAAHHAARRSLFQQPGRLVPLPCCWLALRGLRRVPNSAAVAAPPTRLINNPLTICCLRKTSPAEREPGQWRPVRCASFVMHHPLAADSSCEVSRFWRKLLRKNCSLVGKMFVREFEKLRWMSSIAWGAPASDRPR